MSIADTLLTVNGALREANDLRDTAVAASQSAGDPIDTSLTAGTLVLGALSGTLGVGAVLAGAFGLLVGALKNSWGSIGGPNLPPFEHFVWQIQRKSPAAGAAPFPVWLAHHQRYCRELDEPCKPAPDGSLSGPCGGKFWGMVVPDPDFTGSMVDEAALNEAGNVGIVGYRDGGSQWGFPSLGKWWSRKDMQSSEKAYCWLLENGHLETLQAIWSARARRVAVTVWNEVAKRGATDPSYWQALPGFEAYLGGRFIDGSFHTDLDTYQGVAIGQIPRFIPLSSKIHPVAKSWLWTAWQQHGLTAEVLEAIKGYGPLTGLADAHVDVRKLTPLQQRDMLANAVVEAIARTGGEPASLQRALETIREQAAKLGLELSGSAIDLAWRRLIRYDANLPLSLQTRLPGQQGGEAQGGSGGVPSLVWLGAGISFAGSLLLWRPWARVKRRRR